MLYACASKQYVGSRPSWSLLQAYRVPRAAPERNYHEMVVLWLAYCFDVVESLSGDA